MNKSIFYCCASFLFFSGCVSVNSPSVVLPKGFDKDNYSLYAFEEPAWRLSDHAFEQQLGKYNVVDVDVSGKSTDSSVKERELHLNGFLNWAVFGESLQKRIESWNTTTQQKYSFRLGGQYSNQYSARCEILTQGVAKQVKNSNFEANTTSQSKLLCQVSNDNQTWNLLIEKLAGHSRVAKLWQGSLAYGVEFSRLELSTFDRGSNTQRASIPWHLNNRITGVELSNSEKLVSVNSLAGQPKIWLDNTLTEQDTALFLSVNYAISMYDWLSGDFDS